MARMARVVIPGYPHHVTQRGNRRQTVFFSDADYLHYIDLMAEYTALSETEVWAYCLMPNHVHLVMVPKHEDGLRAALGEAHRRYTRRINFRNGWRGHLWQERFHSFVMDERYLLATVRYVELNPVKAKLCREPCDWPWSSARAHLEGKDGRLVNVRPMLERVRDWSSYLSSGDLVESDEVIERHTRTGRPLGSEAFVERLEVATGRSLAPKPPGRRAQQKAI
jgi:putative transposase